MKKSKKINVTMVDWMVAVHSKVRNCSVMTNKNQRKEDSRMFTNKWSVTTKKKENKKRLLYP